MMSWAMHVYECKYYGMGLVCGNLWPFNGYYIVFTAALYGKGVYFALNSSYSAQPQYSKPNKDGHQSMFVCEVIIGEYTVGKKNMNAAPPLAEGSNEAYDTLVEKKENPTIFVALTDAQAYPEYLLTFKKNK